ncbi:hypothetical protein CHS0354_025753 [Potamilus streckersoni]|uniref:Uncharacterized protein n=1 Tax=Potamilus streckersoni TaxID=2493646 RepID=A0AAE0RUL6_9BIVA|nr:hypothetical protein CHS0354_025753 [Potamilus streckersoni]
METHSLTYEIANGMKTAPVTTTDTTANADAINGEHSLIAVPLVLSGTENKTSISDALSPTGKIPATELIQSQTGKTPTTELITCKIFLCNSDIN